MDAKKWIKENVVCLPKSLDELTTLLEVYHVDKSEQQPEVSDMTLSQLRDRVITGPFAIGEGGIKEPVSTLGKSDWEFYANRLEEMILKGYFFHHPKGSENNHKMVDFVDSLALITEYVDGDKIAHRFNGLTIPVIEFNEMRDKAKKWPHHPQTISDERIEKLWMRYRYHLVHTDAMDEAGFKAALKELKR